MANFTPNVNLEKPLGSEHYLVPKFNANMDKIDAEFGEVAPKDSPELTGVPTAPTALAETNTNQIATTAFVKAVIAALVDSSPTTLDTLNELAAALGDDPNFATTMATELGLRAPKESPALTGTPTAPTAPLGANTLQIANSAFVKAQIANDSVPPNNPIFTGLITSGGQIKFPATQVPSADPNTLDDYEEGTFTPTITGSTVAGVGTYTLQEGNYTKNGNTVTATIGLNVTAHTGTGNMRISGLPFALKNGITSSTHFLYYENLTLTSNNYAMAIITQQANFLTLLQIPIGTGTNTFIPMDSSSILYITLTYLTN